MRDSTNGSRATPPEEEEDAAAMFANVPGRLDGSEWGRMAIDMYTCPTKQVRTLGWIAVRTLHEVRHHLWNVQRSSPDRLVAATRHDHPTRTIR